VVEGRGRPGSRRVALLTFLAELALVLIVFGVTRYAGRAGAGEGVVRMAFRTSGVRMLSIKRETGRAVVETGRLPARDLMAPAAVLAQLVLVRVIFGVTAHTVPAGIGKFLLPGMAVAARQWRVPPIQWEARPAVIELRQLVFAVVAAQAIIPVISPVLRHESGVETRMAIATRGLVKVLIAVLVAVLAGDGRTGCGLPVLRK